MYASEAPRVVADASIASQRLCSRIARAERYRRAAAASARHLDDDPPNSTMGRRHRVEYDHLAKASREALIQLREQAAALGKSCWDEGVSPERMKSTITRAVERALESAPMADVAAADALSEDLVHWATQGYDRAMVQP